MTRPLALRIVPEVGVAEWAGLGAALLDRFRAEPEADPELVVAPLAGDRLVLGRWQRARSALRSPDGAVRRLGGGRAARAGSGTVGILLAAPATGIAGPVGPDRVLNRYVRGLRIGLEALGARGTAYFGRDAVVSGGRKVALLSQEGTATGAAVMEALLAVDRPLALAAGEDAYPEHSDPRAAGAPAGTLAEAVGAAPPVADLAEAIARGYEQLHGIRIVPAAGPLAPAPAPGPAVLEDESGLERSGVADVPIGFVEALARIEGAEVAEVRFRGDFMAPALWIADVESRLRGCPLSFETLGRRIDEAFRSPGVFLHGVTKLRVFADAVLAAAGRGP